VLCLLMLLSAVLAAPLETKKPTEQGVVQANLVQASTNQTAVVKPEATPEPITNKKVLVAVVTAPQHEDARNAIRNTWGKLSRDHAARVDVRFFVGKLAADVPNAEAIDHSLTRPDVVRLDTFTEHYFNLTAKAKGIFDWAYRQNYASLMKVDDDSFVRIDKLLDYIDAHRSQMDAIYAGHINRAEYGECEVHKNPASKWFMYDQYPHDNFPDFADGPGFLLGRKALEFLSREKDHLPEYRCDDAAVGIWTEGLGLEKIEMSVDIYEFGCSSSHILTNPVSAGEMYTLANFPQICESGYNIEVCLDQPCLCKGHPERSRCWQEIIDQPYRDIIPRL